MLSILRTLARRILQKPGAAMLATGSLAPDFSVRDHTGKTHTLGDYRGRKLVLWFYPKADTPG